MSIFGNPVPDGDGGFVQSADGTISHAGERTSTERNIDKALDVAEHPAVGYTMAAGGVGYAAATGGMAAGGVALAAAGAGIAAGAAGAWVGDKVGHAVMSRIPGFTRLPENGEMPATEGMPIAHTSRWATFGALALGAVAAVGVAVFVGVTLGAGAIVVAVAAGAVGGLCMGFASAAGQYGTNKGTIAKGSANVRFNNKGVARVTDLVACSNHGGPQFCAEGAETVFANSLPIARIGNKTTCDGVINDGSTNIAVDIDISAISMDIDGGWLERWTRIGVVVMDFLPINTQRKPADTTAPRQPRGGDDGPPPPRPPDADGNTAPTPRADADGNTAPTPRPDADGNTAPKPRADADGNVAPARPRADADGNTAPNPRPDASGNKTPAAEGCNTCKGDPIDVATGQLSDTRTDIYVPATIPLNLTRTYARTATGLMGNGWASTWGCHLRRDGDLTIYQDPNGADITFHTPHDEVYSIHVRRPNLELYGDLRADLHLYDWNQQLTYTFGQIDGNICRLSQIRDRNGNKIQFSYSTDGLFRVTHSDGVIIDVTSSEGIIRSAALRDDPNNDCVFAWDYSRNDQLTEARSSQMGTLKYGYDEKGRIIRWADDKDTDVFYEYDNTDRIIRSGSKSGHMGVTLDHYPEEEKTVVKDALGNISTFYYNSDGVVTKEIDPLGGVWLTNWDTAYNVTSRVNPLGHTSTFTYDSKGNSTSAEDPTGAKLSWKYNDMRLLVSRTDAAGCTETLTYDDRGNLLQITDADGGDLRLRRGDKGEVLRVEQPGGGQQRIYYDRLMRPRLQVSGDGHEIRTDFDVEGRVTMVEDGEGQVTKYDTTRGPKNPRGSVRQITAPDGTVTCLEYDIEGQLSGLRDAEGQTKHFTYGAFDLPITSTDSLGKKMTLEHDREMRLTAVINAAGERYDYLYDAVGALISERDFSGLVTKYTRDLASRVTKKTAPDGTVTHYTYSDRGDLIEMKVGGAVTRFEYDARGLMILAENADAKVEYAYDALGRVVSEKLDGREVTSAYEQSSGLRTGRGGDALALAASFSDGGLLQDIKVAGHAALRFSHDKRGLEVLRQSDTGFALAQGYTQNAQLKTQIAGQIDQLPDDARKGMMSISTRYDPGYGVGARTYRSFEWDKAGRAVGITDSTWGETRLSYDPRGQVSVTQQINKSGYEVARTQFAYDATRNISGIQTAQGQEPVQQSNGGRVLSRGHAAYRYDACGRVIEKRVEEPGFRPKIWKMEWDGESRLVRLTTPDGAVWGYGYDALGRRIRRLKLVEGKSEETDAPDHMPAGSGMAYQWDGDQIAAEAPVYADGTVAWDAAEAWVYEPGSFRPMAKVVGDELYYVVTDHIGTPRELVTEDGKRAAWRARIGLWGDLQEEQAWKQHDNDDHAPLTCDIRFQGQWYDEESGLHYNRFRYYDPEATQYLSPDPIGLAGGTRPQGYATDPNGGVDPLGLAVCPTRYENYKTLREQGFSAQDAAHYSRGAGNYHAIGRHGPQVTNGQLLTRARTGRLPDTGTIPPFIQNGNGSPPNATRFDSWDSYRTAYDAAHAQRGNQTGPITVNVGQGTLGTGVPSINSPNRVPGARPTADTATAVFNNNGELVTLYPDM